MCGRYALFGPISRRRGSVPDLDRPEWFDVLVERINTGARRFNVAPTGVMPVVGVSKEGEVTIRDLRWGLVPYWSKDIKIGVRAINARAETVAEKPMFREAFKRRRCLVPASGYFEWKLEEGGKQPYFIHGPDEPLLMFAGLWESWREKRDDREADPLRTYTIVTGPPGVVSGDVHDRAPVILPFEQWETWLLGDVDAAAGLLVDAVEPPLAYHVVSKAVGSPKNDTSALVDPVSTR